MQGVERNKVQLIPHDDAWDKEFMEVKTRIEKEWHPNVIDIQHIGSTAIRKIYAKPILDIAVVLESLDKMNINTMKAIGYDYCGPQNPEKSRHLFVLRGTNEISLHHVHCYEQDDENLLACIAFRDFLNNHPQDAIQYSELKIRLAKRYPDDRIAYTNAKEEFIQAIYDKAMLAN